MPSVNPKEIRERFQDTMKKEAIDQILTTQLSGGISHKANQNPNNISLAQPKKNSKPYLNETELLEIHSKEKNDAIEQVDYQLAILIFLLQSDYNFHIFLRSFQIVRQ